MDTIEESRGCSDKEEEEEEENMIIREERFSNQNAAAMNFNANIDLMDLSLGNKDNEAAALIHGCTSTSASGASAGCSGVHGTNYNYCSSTGHESIEKEHMFDKVVTPSDVGKLNRLVIPKQHAEKYFPLDSSSNDKGLLLNFEDRNGKSWRFRYSYWNSSQSYVMTKGWSRFVKEKKLDAGDIVSFQRGVGDLHKHRLFIDWRRRPDHHAIADHPTAGFISPLLISNQPHLSQYSIRWSGRLYSLPQPSSISRQQHDHMQQMNYNFHPYYHHLSHQQQQHPYHHYDSHGSSTRRFNEVNSGAGSPYCSSSPATPSLQNQAVRQDGDAPMVIDSVPIAHHSGNKTASKKLRLFGVNMECSPLPDEEPRCHILSSTVVPPHVNVAMSTNSVPPHHLPSSSHLPLQLRLPHHGGATMASSYCQGRFQEKGESSLPFDNLDPSMKYFR